MKKEDISVKVANDELTIRAKRETVTESDQPNAADDAKTAVTHHRAERQSGSMMRRMALPAGVDAAAIESSFVDGVLSISVPKPRAQQPAEHVVHIKT